MLDENEKVWFELDQNKAHEELYSTFEQIRKRSAAKKERDTLNYRLFHNQDLGKITGNKRDDVTDLLVFNVVQTITDTIVSKIGKNKPRITFLTDKGSWKQKKKAENLDMFIQGQFLKSKVYAKTPSILKRACVYGDGFGKLYSNLKSKEICLDVKHTGNLYVDDIESVYGEARTLYEITGVSTHYLKAMYPEHAKKIDEACKIDLSDILSLTGSATYKTSMVALIEAWRLPSYKGAGDGRHIIALSNVSLLDEEWKYSYFPFPSIKFSEKLLGWWGVGIPELIEGIQWELNRTATQIKKSIKRAAVPRVFYEYSSDVLKQMTNNPGEFVGYSKIPPTIATAVAVNSDVFNHLDRLFGKAFEVNVVSASSFTSKKPAGLNSGIAIREANDVETERFATLQSVYDDLHLDIAQQMMDRAKEIAAIDKNYSILAKAQDGAIQIKWKEVDMDEDAYIMQPYPTNLLPQHPAGRLEKVIEMVNSEMLTKQEGRSLLDYPDIKAITSLDNAKLNDIMLTLNKIIEDGEYNRPEPYQDLAMGIQYAQAFYLTYKHQDIDQENLDLLQKWMEEANVLIDMMTAPPQGSMAPIIPGQQQAAVPGKMSFEPGMSELSSMQLPNANIASQGVI